MEVKFYEKVDDKLLKFAVIISKHESKWFFCKHRERNTLEIPGGHRESGEAIDDTARRELFEETGAADFSLKQICVYSVVSDDGTETYGMLYISEIYEFEDELHSEIEHIYITENLPTKWTYPLIQPKLIEEAVRREMC